MRGDCPSLTRVCTLRSLGAPSTDRRCERTSSVAHKTIPCGPEGAP